MNEVLESGARGNGITLVVGVGADVDSWAQRKGVCVSDLNQDTVRAARAKGLEAFEWDCTAAAHPFEDRKFRKIVCHHVLEHVSTDKVFQVAKNFNALLEDGGEAEVVVPSACGWFFWDDPTHARPYTLISLRNLFLLAGFSERRTEYCGLGWLPFWVQRLAGVIFKFIPVPLLAWIVRGYYVKQANDLSNSFQNTKTLRGFVLR